jgi:magnesium chelatase family protein
MLARAHTFTLDGLCVRRVAVEVDVRRGLPAFTIIGLADTAIRESRERVRTAILNSGFEFPARRVTASLAPADVRKAGPGLDLALACALLAATGQLPRESLARHALLGELALDGSVRGVHGTLAIADAARRAAIPSLALAASSAHEATLVPGLEVAPVTTLRSAARVLRGGRPDAAGSPSPHGDGARRMAAEAQTGPDLAEVRGQRLAVHALIVAAAGGHNLLLSGAPGTGKTMLAQRLPSILPPLTPQEAIEVACVASLAGRRVSTLARERPFRAPHHSVSAAGLLGGARAGSVGEVVLAHNGVLFLDELAEFARPVLEALRQPLEEGSVAIARAHHRAVYPARFMLIAATNPCPCGEAGERDPCACGETELARHRRRLSGPLLDRTDLLAVLARETPGQQPMTTSAAARELVLAARERQAARRLGARPLSNAQLDAHALAVHARLDGRAEAMLRSAATCGKLSARGQQRVLRVARTLADLDGSARVRVRDVGAALALRPEAALTRADTITAQARAA